MKEANKYFNRNLRFLRENRGMQMPHLALALRVSIARIRNWEDGRSMPDNDMLLSIAKYFTVRLDSLLKKDLRKTMKANTERAFSITDFQYKQQAGR